MKQVTILKVGYTAGIYGCSNEYFNAIYVSNKGLQHVAFKGMYGAEERVQRAFEAKGFDVSWIPTDYGKMTTRGSGKVMDGMFKSEKQAIEHVMNLE